MRVTYSTTFAAVCPVDGATDIYQLTVTMENNWVAVESILSAVAVATGRPAYQEAITELLSELLGDGAVVETVGTHSGVLTRVTA